MDTWKLLYKLISLYDDYTTKVKYYEKERRYTIDSFYKKSYQTQIHKYNAKRELIKELINWLRGDEINDNQRSK